MNADRGRLAARLVATAVFVGLLATPLVIRQRSSRSGAAGPALGEAGALERYGFALREYSDSAGIRFTHQAPALDPKLDPILPWVAAYGAGVAVTDFDRDGWQDLYATNSAIGSRNALYRNRGDGTFEDVAAALDVADVNQAGTGVSMGAVWGDYDNDGYEDLLVYKWGRPELFHNDAGRRFTVVTGEAGLPAWINANTAVWFDYDRDGRLDLFVGCFYPDDVDLWNLPTTKILPESFEYAQNGGRNYLFHNAGDGRFEDVTARAGLTSRRWTLAAAAADVDGDGDPDLFVANDFGVNELYLNEGGGRFRDVGRESNLGRAPKSGMGASFGDVLNRGSWTLFVTNISEPGVLIHGNDLWIPSQGPGEGPSYRNLAGAMGVELGGFPFGAQFGDLNNDGWLDLVVANGFVTGESPESYWYDYSMVAGGHEGIIADARHWPAMRGRSLSGSQEDQVWLNDGAGRFQNVARAVGAANPFDGRAVAVADLWNRGVLDLLIAYQRGPLLVYRNRVAPNRSWIGFALEGKRSNRSAIGAEVRLYWDGVEQMQQVDGGSGFASQNQRRTHFGLGTAATVDSALIRWPSGLVQRLVAPAVGTLHRIVEPT
ncbi:MAG: CRTAC1 family protein [Gemmatimonadota bacterium]|nr:CRTAC1 family protein [Gemmatimonadota bacterium]MDH5197932.1 CRTAC1 family protein [Gemmatimonadota bacterium]